MRALTVDWVTYTLFAASTKLPVSTTARKVFARVTSMSVLFFLANQPSKLRIQNDYYYIEHTDIIHALNSLFQRNFQLYMHSISERRCLIGALEMKPKQSKPSLTGKGGKATTGKPDTPAKPSVQAKPANDCS